MRRALGLQGRQGPLRPLNLPSLSSLSSLSRLSLLRRARILDLALGLSVGSGTLMLGGVCPGGCAGGCASCASSLSLLAVPVIATGLRAVRQRASGSQATAEPTDQQLQSEGRAKPQPAEGEGEAKQVGD